MLENEELNEESEIAPKKLYAVVSIACLIVLAPVSICAFKDSDTSVRDTCLVLTIIALTSALFAGFKFFQECVRGRNPDDTQPLDITAEHALLKNSP